MDTFSFAFRDVGNATSLLHYGIVSLSAEERQALGYSKHNTMQQQQQQKEQQPFLALVFSTRPEGVCPVSDTF